MYNTKVFCTYNTPEVFIEHDIVTETDKDFIRNALYRQELLDIFCLDDYNEDEICKMVRELYKTVKECNELKECMNEIASHFFIQDASEIGLMILYSYDYMHLTHICVSEFIENGKINENSILKLKNVIK